MFINDNLRIIIYIFHVIENVVVNGIQITEYLKKKKNCETSN